MIAQNAFLEYAHVHANSYGTPKRYVNEMLADGYDVILEIDVQGALNVKENAPDASLIFLTPPSLDELEKRLRGRNTEPEAEIRLRLANATQEYALARHYDYLVVNGSVDRAVVEIEAIIRTKHAQMDVCSEKISRLLKGETIS